jgi:WD40 repeat protein
LVALVREKQVILRDMFIGWTNMTLKVPENPNWGWQNPDTLDVSDDGQTIVGASGGGLVWIWNAEGALLRTLQGHLGSVISVRLSPNGKALVTCGEDGSARLWNVATAEPALAVLGNSKIASGAIGVGFSPDGKYVGHRSNNTNCSAWDVVTGQPADCSFQIPANPFEATVAETPIGKVHLEPGTATEYSATVRRFETEEIICRLTGHTFPVWNGAFSPDGSRVVTVSMDARGKVWELPSGREQCTLLGHTLWVCCAQWSSDGRRIVTGGFDKSVRVWDAITGKELLCLSGHRWPVMSVAISNDGRQIAARCSDGTIWLWKGATSEQVATWDKEDVLLRSLRNQAE